MHIEWKKQSRFFLVCTEMCTNNNHVTNQVITVFQIYIKKQRLSLCGWKIESSVGVHFYILYSSSTIILDAFLVGLCDFKTSRIPFLYVAIF